MAAESTIISKASEIKAIESVNHIISDGERFIIAVKAKGSTTQRILLEYECGSDFQLELEAVIKDIKVT